MKNRFLASILVLVLCAASACGGGQEMPSQVDAAGGPLRVVTTFYPMYYFAQAILGDSAEVSCPLPAGSDPIFWKPEDKDLVVFREADLVIANGAGYEKWMEVVSLPDSRVLRTAQPLGDQLIFIKEGKSHSHGGGGKHSHVGIDGHTWVDPENARVQARTILERALSLLPDETDHLKKRFRQLDDRLDKLSRSFAELGRQGGGTPLLASHPAYNYLARRMGLNLKSLDLDPADALSDSKVAEIREILKKHPARSMLWESEPLAEVKQILKEELGLSSLVFSPCEDPALVGQDYFKLMEANLENLRQALATH